MKPFSGFPQKMRLTPLPNIFFSQLLPQIDDITELKVTLHLFWVLYGKRGYPKFVTYGELLGDRLLMIGVGSEAALRSGLEGAVSRGTIIDLNLEQHGRTEKLYFLNTGSDSEARNRIKRGEIDVGVLPEEEPFVEDMETEEQHNIFTLYEENIGMLAPMIAEELKAAEQLYPVSWIDDAFREAVSRNKRNWKYIEAILKRWDSEGREHGAPGRHSKADRDTIKRTYGHLVKRRID
ncbi:MAG: DnaD domain protein [Dehalococcoidia bacterium]|nr:DnaD domain protein [Dehalococcoidia bacterium]